jgi:hypothetical protein
MSDEEVTSDGEAGSAADGESAGAVTTLLRWWVHYPAVILITIFAFLWDPFGWETETANLSNDLVQRPVIGPLIYTGRSKGFRQNRAKSTVVLFSDSDLKAYDTDWPMPLWVHAEILERILAHKPKGVFVDFVFYDKRDGDGAEELRDIIKTYKKKSIPLWFARAEGPGIDRPIRKDLWGSTQGSDDVVRPKLVSVVWAG